MTASSPIWLTRTQELNLDNIVDHAETLISRRVCKELAKSNVLNIVILFCTWNSLLLLYYTYLLGTCLTSATFQLLRNSTMYVEERGQDMGIP
jgi:hypothetical protein